ncbi:MAG: hypothetical protein HYZ34_05965 [Ignavibacteriae bacterium]|nr:hypothetical protein [Ignavibacteriota bacterium]
MAEIVSPADLEYEMRKRFPTFSSQQIENLVVFIVEYCSGKYINGKHLFLQKRNQHIRESFHGNNIHEIAKQFHLSIRQIRRVLKEKY